MECYSCVEIAKFDFVLQGRINTYNSGVSCCCRDRLKKDIDGSDMEFPIVPFDKSPAKTLQNFISMRNKMLEKGKWGGAEGIARDPKFACYHCDGWLKANWSFSSLIQMINPSIYPAPCQYHCSYCTVNDKYGVFNYNDELKKAYEKAFEVVNLAKKQRIIAPVGASHWHVASGEITIHPYKKQFLDLTRGEKVTFYTNGCIFDEDIARELHNNPMAEIHISIDSGTAETWHKVKGVNNFDKVLENLVDYKKCSSPLGQITVQYIILPDINDSDKDFVSCVNILRALDIKTFRLSRDVMILRTVKMREQIRNNEILDEAVVYSAARLMALCMIVGINPTFNSTYTFKEREKICQLAMMMIRNKNGFLKERLNE